MIFASSLNSVASVWNDNSRNFHKLFIHTILYEEAEKAQEGAVEK